MTQDEKDRCRLAQASILGALSALREEDIQYQVRLSSQPRRAGFNFYTDAAHREETAEEVLLDLVKKFEDKGALTKQELIQLVVRAKKCIVNF